MLSKSVRYLPPEMCYRKSRLIHLRIQDLASNSEGFWDPSRIRALPEVFKHFRLLRILFPGAVILKFYCASESLGEAFQSSLGSTLRVSHSVGMGWDLRICNSNKFPGGCWCCCSRDYSLRTTALEYRTRSSCPQAAHFPRFKLLLAAADLQ